MLVVRPQPGQAVTSGVNARKPHGLQQFLRHDDFARARFVGLRRERNADRVADAFLQQHRKRRGRGNDALGAHARLGQAQVQGIVAARGEVAINRDQFLHTRNLARQHDTIAS